MNKHARRTVFVAAAITFAACLLSACEPPRRCLDWDTQYVPVMTNHCYPVTNGKTTTSRCFPTTTYQWVSVCMKWEEPTPTPESREPQ